MRTVQQKEAEITEKWSTRSLSLKLLLAACSLGVCAGAGELGLRLFFSKALAAPNSERTLLCRYDATLGWFPTTNTTRRFTASRAITVSQNRYGFRDPEPVFDGRPGIMFLGDSYVWGFDVEHGERFTDLIRARHPNWNVYNLGVSGYGTDQEFLLLVSKYDLYQPRAVVLVFCAENDIDDCSSNIREGGYYKPYCLAASNTIVLKGVPVPKGEPALLSSHPVLSHSCLFRAMVRAYVRACPPPVIQVEPNPIAPLILAMRNYVAEKGAFFGVAITSSKPALEWFLDRKQIPWVALNSTNRYATFGGHWTPEGHAAVSRQIEAFLDRTWSR